jgi:hypothetical protein
MCAYSDALAECTLCTWESCGLVRFARVVLMFWSWGPRWANRRFARGAVGGVRRRDGDGNACSAKREAGRSKIVRGGSEGLKYNRTLLTPIISLKLALRACISQSRFLAHSFAMIDPRLALFHSSGKNLTRLKWPVHATHRQNAPFLFSNSAGNTCPLTTIRNGLSTHHKPT